MYLFCSSDICATGVLGSESGRNCKMWQELRSPRYTARWKSLPEVR
ncbi:DUF4113 domain-containing protein [Hydrotalea flava]